MKSPSSMVGTLILEFRGLLFCMEYLQPALISKVWACFYIFASFFFSLVFHFFFFEEIAGVPE